MSSSDNSDPKDTYDSTNSDEWEVDDVILLPTPDVNKTSGSRLIYT